jgi:phosphomannomutase
MKGKIAQKSSFDEMPDDVLSHLDYEPRPLSFGTSGRRGLVVDLTQIEVYINALAEIEYLQNLPPDQGGITKGEDFFFAYDLRPSSTTFVEEHSGRGELAQVVERAIVDSGMKPINLGCIPTPALTYYSLSQGKGSVMVTGSHIPFDRNGYKTNTSKGELLKKHEEPIHHAVRQLRERVYGESFKTSLFDGHGRMKVGHGALPPVDSSASLAYVDRYVEFFGDASLKGMKLLLYQHSAVGRDLVLQILRRLGAEVMPIGRSETFVPIDTENIASEQLKTIQGLADEAIEEFGRVHAIVSTDGDSDRPLLLGVDANSQVQFFGGDLVGLVAAEYLGADAVVVPISCNDAIDRSSLANALEPKTRIGSPYVIAGMDVALNNGKKTVCGWEANGGFLTGSRIVRNGKTLEALPTRDAVLPILCTLFSAHEKQLSLAELFERLPRRFSCAALLKQFPREISLKIIKSCSPVDGVVKEAIFQADQVFLLDECRVEIPSDTRRTDLWKIRDRLAVFFNTEKGFTEIIRVNYTDGVRINFNNGDIAHLRPSGNADELRIYAVADTQRRADAIASLAVAEPDGILRALETSVS